MSVRLPKYRLHKGSGQALVQINGKRIYVGVYGTKEIKEPVILAPKLLKL